MFKNNINFLLTTIFLGAMFSQATHVFGQMLAPTATIAVHSNADAGGVCPGATCTLRQAIATAAAGDTINFDMTTVTSPITLASTLSISKSLTINGPGANLLTISGNNAVRVFLIDDGDVTLSGLTIANGNVNTDSGVFITRAAGIHNSSCGTVRINDSVISGNNISFVSEGANTYTFGAGISNETATCSAGAKMMILTGSTISGNTAHGYHALGGGIFNFGKLTIVNSTISDNQAVSDSSGGAAVGGGIENESGTLNLTNTTISGNSINRDFGSGIINTDTFGFGSGTASVKNTIIAGNIGSSISDGDVYGAFNSQGYNLIGSPDGSTGFFNGVNGNIIGVDAQLAPLANNGGATPTRALLSNSPAINAGSNALAVDANNQPLNTDQRGTGFARIINAAVDIGAFEFGQSPGQLVRFRTNIGIIDVQLLPQSAPLTVANFLRYVDSGRYNGSFIHRSVPNFIILGGGYRFVNNQTETIPPDAPVVNEFNVSNTRGTLAMAKLGNDPNSATSQWFFNEADNSANLDHQNGGYTVFGRVVNQQGLSVMDAIGALPIYNAGLPFDQLPLINYSGSGNIQASNLVTIYSITRLASSPPTAFDFDGDGKSDVSVFRPSNGTWYLNQSQAGFTGVQFGVSTDRLAPADYDGDGKTDVAVFRPSTGTWYILQSSNNTMRGFSFGAAGDLPRPGDFDGDGRADICVFRPSNGTWYRINSSNNQFVGVAFGQSGDVPLIADFDGDGKSDVSLFRQGVWYYLRSSDGAFRGVSFGASTDLPTVGDYDGDGKSDVAVFRPSNGTWYWLRSSDGGFTGSQFGQSGDVPTAGDYDGDGKTDLAVFRSGTWYVLRSASNSFTGTAFGAPTDAPAPAAFLQ